VSQKVWSLQAAAPGVDFLVEDGAVVVDGHPEAEAVLVEGAAVLAGVAAAAPGKFYIPIVIPFRCYIYPFSPIFGPKF